MQELTYSFQRHDITDDEWCVIGPIIEDIVVNKLGRPYKDLRATVNGVLWISRTGAPWRDLPPIYGEWNTVYKFHNKLAKNGLMKEIHHILVPVEDCGVSMNDSTSCKAHQHSAGASKSDPLSDVNQHIGLSRGGRNTKIHATVNDSGHLTNAMLTGGNVNDCTVTIDLLNELEGDVETFVGDKAYGTKEIREYCEEKGIEFCVPPKSNTKEPWKYNKDTYKKRSIVENFFLKLKQFRRIATRYDKLARNFLSLVYFCSLFVSLRCV